MSSPLDRDFGPDEPSPYAPKWVRDAADARRGSPAERHATALKAPENLDGEDFRRSAAAPAATNGPVLVDRYRLPPSLEPTLMPEPWAVPRTRSALGLLMRFTVAVAIAAVVALFVVGKFPTSWLIAGKAEKQDSPSFGLRFSGQNAGTAEQPKPAPAQLSLSQEGPRGAREAFPPGVKLTRAVEGATAAQAPTSPAAQQSQASPMAQPPVGPAKGFPIRQLDREEIADLMRRGEAFIATGDLASARLVLQRAAEGGDPRAALTLAGTYDPIVLEKLGIQGFASDIAAARTWYERAKEFGSAEAPRRLEMLASRAR
jgi:TPR repeat protein